MHRSFRNCRRPSACPRDGGDEIFLTNFRIHALKKIMSPLLREGLLRIVRKWEGVVDNF